MSRYPSDEEIAAWLVEERKKQPDPSVDPERVAKLARLLRLRATGPVEQAAE